MILAHLLAVSIGSVLYVAAGIGLVIFFHELGHFAVAKWCNVSVERFSIGFGPVIWRVKWGETEYVLSIVPFGGYVKMLGQDDIDPSQLTSDEIAEDPRSYSAKNVPQRMAIISAGVIMNLITGLLFFACAYGLGVGTEQPIVGLVQVGLPAWEAGMEPGDRIRRINGDTISSFEDIILSVALAPSQRLLFEEPEDLMGLLDPGPVDEELRSRFAKRRIRLPHDAIVVSDTSSQWSIKSGSTTLFQLARSGSGLAVSGNMLKIEGSRSVGASVQSMTWNVLPRGKGTGRKIGLGPEHDTQFLAPETGPSGWPASRAKPALRDKDRLKQINDTPITSVAQMRKYQARHADQELVYQVEREGEAGPVEITVPPSRFLTLGISMDIGQVTSIRDRSPADTAGLRIGDKLITVNGRDIGKAINPLELPNVLAKLSGQDVKIEVLRPQPTGEPETISLTVTPDDQPGWLNPPEQQSSPLAIPSLGLAYDCTVNILAVTPGSPAEKAGIQSGDQISQATITLKQLPTETEPTTFDITFDDQNANWAHAIWMIQRSDESKPVLLHVVGADGKERDIGVTPWRNSDRDWYLPKRGTRHYPLNEIRQATGIGDAMGLAVNHAETTLARIWLTLRSLFTGDISVTELHGPIGIARAAYSVAETSVSKLLIFLGFLSLNLAVINFLPIPVLDGGHMVFLTWEAITRRKPSERVLIAATYFGLAFVLLLMVTVIFLDIERMWSS